MRAKARKRTILLALTSAHHGFYRGAARYAGEPPPDILQRIAPKGVVTRRSTELLAAEDPTVSVALRYIQDNFWEGDLSVGDVVAQCRIPRRSLERAFRRELQRTVLHEILRERVSYAQKLPEVTSLSVTDIAARSGFVNLNHFFRVFQGRTGFTPRKFRLARQLTVSGSRRSGERNLFPTSAL
jgi:LacI family transcriptional regulator